MSRRSAPAASTSPAISRMSASSACRPSSRSTISPPTARPRSRRSRTIAAASWRRGGARHPLGRRRRRRRGAGRAGGGAGRCRRRPVRAALRRRPQAVRQDQHRSPPASTGPTRRSPISGVRNQLHQWEKEGYGHLPVCIAKTQYSFSTDPALLGAPKPPCRAGPRGPPRRRRRLRRRGLRRHHDHARPASVPSAEGMSVDENGLIVGLS